MMTTKLGKLERPRESKKQKEYRSNSTDQLHKPCQTIHHSNNYHDYKKKLSLTTGTLVAALSVAIRQSSGHSLGWQNWLC